MYGEGCTCTEQGADGIAQGSERDGNGSRGGERWGGGAVLAAWRAVRGSSWIGAAVQLRIIYRYRAPMRQDLDSHPSRAAVLGSRSTVLPFCNGSPSSTTAHQHPVPRAGTKQSFSTISAPSSFTLLTAPPPRAVRSRTVLTPADTRNMPQTPDTHRIHIRIQH